MTRGRAIFQALPVRQPRKPADLSWYLRVRTGLRFSKFENCDKGLVFLSICSPCPGNAKPQFYPWTYLWKEERPLKQLFAFLPPT